MYGLVFLFKWNSQVNSIFRKRGKENPSNVYFAKQVVENACATQAILSILLNHLDIEIGSELMNFKQETSDLSAHEKGKAIGDFELLRKVHNEFSQ